MNDFTVHLPPEERAALRKLITSGSAPARKLLYARILLKADRSQPSKPLSDPAIADTLETSKNTVARTRQKYVEHGLETALARRPTRRVYPRKLDGAAEAKLVALACSAPPDGHQRWTLHLLADRLIAFHVVDRISGQTVRRTLKKTRLNRG